MGRRAYSKTDRESDACVGVEASHLRALSPKRQRLSFQSVQEVEPELWMRFMLLWLPRQSNNAHTYISVSLGCFQSPTVG